MILFPNCKINLGLHVIRKRTDGFHDIKTIFYPVALYDALELVPNGVPTAGPLFTSSGLELDVAMENNICNKACQLLKKDYPQVSSDIHLHLHKAIPTGAGLGGGSADGAFTLLLLNKRYGLNLTEDQLIGYALQLGSDCPFFIKNKPCFASGRGERLEEVELDLSTYRILLVNPGIHVNTGQAFSGIRPWAGRPSLKEQIRKPVSEWKANLTNDFEDTVFRQHPAIAEIRDALYGAGAVYAAMSGTGSTVFGLFERTLQPELSFPSHYFIRFL